MRAALLLLAASACKPNVEPPQAPAAPPAPAAVVARRPTPTECLTDRAAHALAIAAEQRSPDDDPPSRLDDEVLDDLNGDGVADRMLVDPFSGTANQERYFYLSTGDCWSYAGTAWAAEEGVTTLPTSHDGVRDLSIRIQSTCDDAGLGDRVDEHHWSVSAQAYKAAGVTVRCPCPMFGEGDAVHAPAACR